MLQPQHMKKKKANTAKCIIVKRVSQNGTIKTLNQSKRKDHRTGRMSIKQEYEANKVVDKPNMTVLHLTCVIVRASNKRSTTISCL